MTEHRAGRQPQRFASNGQEPNMRIIPYCHACKAGLSHHHHRASSAVASRPSKLVSQSYGWSHARTPHGSQWREASRAVWTDRYGTHTHTHTANHRGYTAPRPCESLVVTPSLDVDEPVVFRGSSTMNHRTYPYTPLRQFHLIIPVTFTMDVQSTYFCTYLFMFVINTRTVIHPRHMTPKNLHPFHINHPAVINN